MKLVIDANILFSALLKDSITRNLLLDRRLALFAPKFLITEYAKYSRELRKRSGLKEDEFGELSKRLIRRIKLVLDKEIILYYQAAQSIVSDKKDTPYIACALAIGADTWSNDKHLKNARIKNWTTKELAEKIMK
ncbi:MAG: PIN domain-containing protein [archaeon]|nr:PIN domain-containing protein [archaeon]